MERLGIPAGVFTLNLSAKKDKRRLKKADKQVKEKEKKRQSMQMVRLRREEALREAEGAMYEAGGF